MCRGVPLGAEDPAGNSRLIMKLIDPATDYLKVLHNCENGVGKGRRDIVDLIYLPFFLFQIFI